MKMKPKSKLKFRPRPDADASTSNFINAYIRSTVFTDANIAAIEHKIKGTFVGDFPLPTADGGWGCPAAVFWQECIPEWYKDVPGVSNYVAYFKKDDGHVWVTSGIYLKNRRINGLRAANGELIWSRHRHDFHYSRDGSCFVDGGFDYFRWGGKGTPVWLVLKEDKVVELEVDRAAVDSFQKQVDKGEPESGI